MCTAFTVQQISLLHGCLLPINTHVQTVHVQTADWEETVPSLGQLLPSSMPQLADQDIGLGKCPFSKQLRWRWDNSPWLLYRGTEGLEQSCTALLPLGTNLLPMGACIDALLGKAYSLHHINSTCRHAPQQPLDTLLLR